MWKLFLSTANKCTIAIMILIMINIKSFLKRSFCGISINSFRKQTYWSVLHRTTLMHCKARQVSRYLFSSNHGNDSDMTFGPRATKISRKSLKAWRHQLYSDGRFEPLANSGWTFTWAYLRKALTSSSKISATIWFKIFLTHVITVSCIAVLLPMQQFYITKMMMLIFAIIVRHSYLYSVLWLILKNTYFKEHPWVIVSKYNICNTENNRNLNYVYCLNLAPMKKAWFLAPVEYSRPNEKGIMVPVEYTPTEKACFYKIFFMGVVMVTVKDKS